MTQSNIEILNVTGFEPGKVYLIGVDRGNLSHHELIKRLESMRDAFLDKGIKTIWYCNDNGFDVINVEMKENVK